MPRTVVAEAMKPDDKANSADRCASGRYGFVCYGCFTDAEKLTHLSAAALPTECVRCGEFAYGDFIPEPCRSGLCSAHVTHHSGDCAVTRLRTEATKLAQENERLRIELAAERARRIEAECERNRFRDRLAEGRAN